MWDTICPTFTTFTCVPWTRLLVFFSLFCPAKSSLSGRLYCAPKPNLSSVLAWSTSTLLSTCKCRLGHSLLVALRSASTNPQVPAGFLQQIDTTNRHRITTDREGTQRHTTCKQSLQHSRISQQRVHYRTNQMIQCIVPMQRQSNSITGRHLNL